MSETISISGGGKGIGIVYGNGTVYAGNGQDTIIIYGDGKVLAGNGNDSVTIFGTGKVTVGNGNDYVSVKGDASVVAGSGKDTITLHDEGGITVGGGNDSLSLYAGGKITQTGWGGHDTINLGSGNDTVYEQGRATVWGSTGAGFLGGTISGGELVVTTSGTVTEDIVNSGDATLVGGKGSTEFIGGTGSNVFDGGLGRDTFVGGSGHDTLTGGAAGKNVFEFLSADKGGQDVITNFGSGDTLYLEGYTLAQLNTAHDISTHGGNTYITLDGGKTSIELKGVTHLSSSDVTTHKP